MGLTAIHLYLINVCLVYLISVFRNFVCQSSFESIRADVRKDVNSILSQPRSDKRDVSKIMIHHGMVYKLGLARVQSQQKVEYSILFLNRENYFEALVKIVLRSCKLGYLKQTKKGDFLLPL